MNKANPDNMKKPKVYSTLSNEVKVKLYDEYELAKQQGIGFQWLNTTAEKYGMYPSRIRDWMSKIRRTLINVEDEEDVQLRLKGKSILRDADGSTKMQWDKYDRAKEDVYQAYLDAIDRASVNIVPVKAVPKPEGRQYPNLTNLYISNDVHLGALAWKEETRDRDWDTDIAKDTLIQAIDFLVENSPASKEGIIADLGDLTEIDDFKNMTPTGGNGLDVDSRYSKIITVAMEAMVYMVTKALKKHETVKFINISGNHDITTGHAIRAFVQAWFRDEPRVLVDVSPSAVKYILHGKTLLGFAHGDGLKMQQAGETMAVDCVDIFSNTIHRHFHFGHNHKDSIFDGKICKCESHRNLAPLNAWASHKGFNRGLGSMKCITYDKLHGEINRTTFNVNMISDSQSE